MNAHTPLQLSLQTLDFGLNDTLLALRDAVAAFCKKEIAPIAASVDRDNEFPAHLWKKWVTWAYMV